MDRINFNLDVHNFIKENELTAVVALNDHLALDIIKMCQNMNINIPNDLSIIGIDDFEAAKHLKVPLTVIAQYPDKIGSTAASLLLENINKLEQKEFIKQIFCPVELRIREYCKKID